ncbi:hypothetical protein [Paenibacillus polymyxa]|uniref:hypothetical protein n=1 Tax=Paenibacillus polymyxa TaxID=1406 RepID=UPI0006BFC1F9|nr:hypothetical protein [Paenibacillus polymyxa]KOS02498.1 hypothetical protein AM598_11885 [Paenibacillus polymyxa]
MALISEIEAIEAFIKRKYPDATYEKQTVPEQPTPGLFVVRFLRDGRTLETGMHYRIDRDYQIIHFAKYPEETMPVMSELSAAIYAEGGLPDVHMRFEGFGFGQPVLTENKIYATVGVLQTTVREMKPQRQYDKINHIHPRYV